MPAQLVMNASPGCGLFMHTSQPRAPAKSQKVDMKVDGEELRVEKKLRLMLEKKVSVLSAKLEKESKARAESENNYATLSEEADGLRECAARVKDAQDAVASMRREVNELQCAKLQAERELTAADTKNRDLDDQLVRLEKIDEDRVHRMGELQQDWTSQIDNLITKETILEREKEDLSAELEKVKNEHQVLLQHAQKLVTQYEVETENRLDLEDRLEQMEKRKLEKSEAQKEIHGQEQQKSQRIDAENARLKERIKRQDDDIAHLKSQAQSLTTNLAAKKDDVRSRVGRQIRVCPPGTKSEK